MHLHALCLLLLLLGSSTKAGECRGPSLSNLQALLLKQQILVCHLGLSNGCHSSSQDPQEYSCSFFKAVVVPRNTETCADCAGLLKPLGERQRFQESGHILFISVSQGRRSPCVAVPIRGQGRRNLDNVHCRREDGPGTRQSVKYQK